MARARYAPRRARRAQNYDPGVGRARRRRSLVANLLSRSCQTCSSPANSETLLDAAAGDRPSLRPILIPRGTHISVGLGAAGSGSGARMVARSSVRISPPPTRRRRDETTSACSARSVDRRDDDPDDRRWHGPIHMIDKWREHRGSGAAGRWRRGESALTPPVIWDDLGLFMHDGVAMGGG